MSGDGLVHEIDAQMREAIAINQRNGGRDQPVADTPVPELRRLYATERAYWNAGAPDLPRVEEGAVEGPAGAVPLRLYHPRPDEGAKALVYVHGGGWVVGSNDTHDGIMRKLALASGRAVVGVDYSLAPEARFPTQIDEALAACRALPSLAEGWKLDPTGPVLSGDSAGAQIALATALALRSEPALAPGGLALFYGVYGLRDSRSYRLFDGGVYGLSRRDMDYYTDNLIAEASARDDPRLDLLSADLAGLPPVHLMAAALDPLLDDSLTLAERLTATGEPTAVRVCPGMLHGFLHYSKSVDLAQRALDEAGAWVTALR